MANVKNLPVQLNNVRLGNFELGRPYTNANTGITTQWQDGFGTIDDEVSINLRAKVDFPIKHLKGQVVNLRAIVSAYAGERGLSFNCEVVEILNPKKV